MKDERTFSEKGGSLDERFAEDPIMRKRLHEIADMRDRMLAEGVSLDEVEAKTVEQSRLLGKELLQTIAQAKADQSAAQLLKKTPSAIKDRKKNNLAYHPGFAAVERPSPSVGSARLFGAAFEGGLWCSRRWVFKASTTGFK